MTGGVPTLTQFLIAVGAAFVVAMAIRLFRARYAKDRTPPHIHDVLMKRAEAYAGESPFLAHLCRQYRTNGHLSDRQARTVAKAIARLEAERPGPKRGG
jgi:hypothetical protein